MGARGPLRCSARLSQEPATPAAAARPRGRPAALDPASALRRAVAQERVKEVEDSPQVLKDKCRRLARALRNAKHLVVYTGAGISTAADIPDYRGPRGVWTRLRRGEAVGRVELSRAEPTFTHMALRALWARGALKFVVSQNCDGLHLRSGLPRRALAELHGDMFCEMCAACQRVYVRAFDTTERTARHQHATRRLCHACGRELRDTIVHFGERGRAAWPLNWAGALRHAARADVVLCLGSSLKVLRRYPRLWRMQSAPRARPALYIVNLQWTPKDAVAALKINARCDAVMRQLARRLRLRVPRYSLKRDPVLAHAEPLAPPETHTTRRPLLALRPSSPSSASSPSSPSSSSPSPSDSDEELPLRRLADRLRAPARSQHADALRAFRVNMQSGEATILLRAEHAPSRSLERSPPRSATAELRRFRIVRRRSAGHTFDNGCYPRPEADGVRRDGPGASLERFEGGRIRPIDVAPPTDDLEKFRPKAEPSSPRSTSFIEKEEDDYRRVPRVPVNGTYAVGFEVRGPFDRDMRAGPDEETKLKREPKEESALSAEGSLAAAIIARAVLVCRASLYSGLHTIIAPSAPAPPKEERVGAECAWCARRFSSARCLWYGPPRETPPSSRAWRRVCGRRFLCACCGPDASPADVAADSDGGGWYGKGYRKGRRRRR